MRVQLQQSVAALLELLCDLRMCRGSGADELIQLLDVSVVRCQSEYLIAKFLQQLVGTLQVALEGIQPLVIPAGKHLLRAVLEVGRVHVDSLRLADAIEPANTLLEQLGIER